MKKFIFAVLSFSLIVSSCSSHKKDSPSNAPAVAEQPARPATLTPEQTNSSTQGWSAPAKNVLNQFIAKYGQPNEATATQATWNNNGSWKRSVIRNEGGQAVLEQTANLYVPPERLGDISLFDKSISVDQSTNEVTAKSHSEDQNFLNVNLTKEIVDGRMGSMEARRQSMNVKDALNRTQYMQRLNF